MRQPKPFWNKQKQCWYVQFSKRQIRLSRDEKEAWELYHKLMAHERPASGITARALLEQYWQWAQGNLAPSTLERREPRLRSLSLFLGDRIRAEDVKGQQIQKWLQSDFADVGQTTKSDLIGMAKTVFNWAVETDYLKVNPIGRLKRPASKVRQDFVPFDQWPKLLSLATDQEFRDFIEFMLRTGIRVQEILRVEARHLHGDVCHVPTKPKKGVPQIRPIWLDQRAREIAERLASIWKEGPIFRNRRGRPWTRNSIKCRFRYLKREMKMSGFCATTLRHSFSHYRLTQGQDSTVVAKLMGHSDTGMLMRRYGHLGENTQFMLQEANRFGQTFQVSDPPLNE